jgi:hypothetical protein
MADRAAKCVVRALFRVGGDTVGKGQGAGATSKSFQMVCNLFCSRRPTVRVRMFRTVYVSDGDARESPGPRTREMAVRFGRGSRLRDGPGDGRSRSGAECQPRLEATSHLSLPRRMRRRRVRARLRTRMASGVPVHRHACDRSRSAAAKFGRVTLGFAFLSGDPIDVEERGSTRRGPTSAARERGDGRAKFIGERVFRHRGLCSHNPGPSSARRPNTGRRVGWGVQRHGSTEKGITSCIFGDRAP